jgi:hypothetical protein
VTWRTVAEDGHPITGKFSFTTTGEYEGNDDYPTCAATDTDNGVYANTPEVKKTTAQPADPTLWLTLGGFIVVLLTVGFSVYKLKTRKPKE